MGSRQLLASWLRGDCEAVLPEVRTYVGTLARALPVCVADLLTRTVLEIIRRTSTVDQYQREGKHPGEPHPHDAARSPSLRALLPRDGGVSISIRSALQNCESRTEVHAAAWPNMKLAHGAGRQCTPLHSALLHAK